MRHNHTNEINIEIDKRKVASVNTVSLADAVVAAGATPTKDEFDAVVALANDLKAKLNSLLTNMKASNLMKS